VSGLKGNPASLAKFAASLREIPRVLAQRVATASAPVLTSAATATFAAGQNAYGTPWVPKADGTKATLVDTGALASKIRYVSIGTKIRVALGVAYAKYQIGKRPVFPAQGGRLPVAYVRALETSAATVIREELAQ